MDLRETLHYLEQSPDYRNLKTIGGVRVDLKYATSDNFMSKNVYGDFTEAFLHQKAASLLENAATLLKKNHPGFSLLVFDALRPRSVQRLLWNHVKGTEQENYVANPDRGSVHNFGLAIDLTVCDENGKQLDMGTGFDTFIPLSQPKLESHFLEKGELSKKQHENRLILRKSMTESGFHQLSHEWWHYDTFPADFVRANFQIIE